MKRELVALLFGDRAGRLLRDGDRVSFSYDDVWRRRDDAVPISLSMPLLAEDHDRRTIEAYLWGLLPDNDAVLESWGREFQVSPRNPFALIAHVGEDCAGAVQFAAPARIPALLAERPPEIAWQTEEESLRLNPGATIERAAELARRVGHAAPLVRDELLGHGLDHPIVPHLAQKLVERAEACLRTVEA